MAILQGQEAGDLWEVGRVIRKPHPNPSPSEKGWDEAIYEKLFYNT